MYCMYLFIGRGEIAGESPLFDDVKLFDMFFAE